MVGLFTAGGSAADSEVWVDFQDLARSINRVGTVSCVQLRAASPADLDRIKNTVDNDTQFRLVAVPERDYFADQSRESLFLKGAGTLIAVFLTIGAMFSAANTMYAAVSARTREIGTLRALGFPRRDILLSFLGESVLLCAWGRSACCSPCRWCADLRHHQLQHLRRGHRLVSLRPPGHDGRAAHDPGDGRLRRPLPRPPRCGSTSFGACASSDSSRAAAEPGAPVQIGSTRAARLGAWPPRGFDTVPTLT